MGVNERVTWSAYRCSSQRKYTSYYTSTCKVGEVTKACVLVEHVRKPMEFKLLQWNAYIQQTETDDNVKLMQLQAACDDQLQQRVFDSVVYPTLTKPDLFLQKMKELAVITVYTAVHLRNLCSNEHVPLYFGLTSELILSIYRANCKTCSRYQPSNPALPPVEPEAPVYPFQSICADFLTISGHNFLAIVDRYSNW